MPVFDIDPDVLADLKHQNVEVRRLEAALRKTDSEITSLCEKLSHAQETAHSQRDALADARHQFNELAATVASSGLQSLLQKPGAGPSSAAAGAVSSPPQGPREKTEWVYSKLRRRQRSQVELCEVYSAEFGKPSQSLITFLATSKYFRKTGTPGDFCWSISANRDNDLREYLA
jgi:hypothetical protein